MAEPLKLPCPECGSLLKLRDRSVLGRNGKCPGCGHRFLLREPEPAAVELEFDEPAAAVAPATPRDRRAGGSSTVAIEAGDEGESVLTRRRRSRRRKRTPEIAVGVLSALALAAIGWYAWPLIAGGPAAPRRASAEVREERAAAQEAERSGFAGAAESGAEPITLRAMPAGVSLLVHLRPAELWGPRWADVRAATGPLAPWAAGELERLTGFPPVELAECTVGWVLGPRGSDPQVCAVATFAAPRDRAATLAGLPGRDSTDFAAPLRIGGGTAWMPLADPADPAKLAGLAVAPAAFAPDLDPAAALTAPAVEGLLPATDRRAPLTVVFQPLDLDLHRDTLLPAPVRPLADAVRGAFAGWTESAAVGFAPARDGDGVTLTLAVRGTTDDVASTFGPRAGAELAKLPAALLAHVRTLTPATMGRRRLVGRLPAMLAAAVAARTGGTDGRVYRAAAALPASAGPNLALASLLTWDAGLAGPPATAPAVADAGPDDAPLEEKLGRPVEVDFRRTPLQEAFQFLASEAGFAVELDGAAIRDAGMTRNMPQEFALGRVSARDAVARILQNHPKLCVVADRPAGTLLVTTRDAAAAAGFAPLPLGPGAP